MKDNLRLSMSWLHTWAGLWASWILFAIFFTGTLSIFSEAITQWMKPEISPVSHHLDTTEERARAAGFAQQHLLKVAPKGHFWSMELPSAKDPLLRVYWEDENEKFHSALLHPQTGEVIPKASERDTEGGRHFVRTHYEFQAGTAGIWLVGFSAMAMLVGLVSGIIIHKRIFKDFFTFRPGKGQRSWLDSHNAVAVLTLPFQLMITYTGLAIFFSLYMPAAIEANYKDSDDFFSALLAQPQHRDETHIAAPVTDLARLLARMETGLQRASSFIVVDHPGDSSASVTVYGPFDEGEEENFLVSPDGGRMVFDGVTGEELDKVLPRSERGGPVWTAQQAMAELHMASFGGLAIKWLYFLCGMAGAAMIATGSLLFMVKRRKKQGHEFGTQTLRVYTVIDSLNVGAIAGLMLACIGYFWINRLLPPGIEQRADWETRTFFIIWLLTFIHAGFRSSRTAWLEQLNLAALLCLGLPVLNLLTTGSCFIDYWQAGDWIRLGVELAVSAWGLLLAFSAWKLGKAPAGKQARTRHTQRAGRNAASRPAAEISTETGVH